MFCGWSSTTSTVACAEVSPVMSRSRGVEEVMDLLLQPAHADGLLHVAVEAGGIRPVAVLVHGGCRDRHDGHRAASVAPADLPQRLHPVDRRELEVHEDQVGFAAAPASRTPSSPDVASMTS